MDRWHPSNVEWPNEKATSATCLFRCRSGVLGEDKPGRGALSIGGIQVIPADAYEALYADRGRVLAAARELARSIEAQLDEDYRGNPPHLPPAQRAALASFREVDQ